MVLGIDLGTTQSCVAFIDETGRPAIGRSAIGEDTTPSAVYFESPDCVVVGRAAVNEALVAPDLVAQLVKRDIGTGREYLFHGERHTPESVSALILRELVRATEEQTGKTFRDVVITVPAYFGIAEREATRRAGEIAGLNVLDVLAEPVAAAMHYTSLGDHAGGGTRHILVYDLGGGTFDTTVIRLDGDQVTVICTDGDARLGGADWDQAIAGYLLSQVKERDPLTRPEADPQFMQDLLIIAEQLKKELSSAQSRRRVLRFDGTATTVELTRAMVEDLTADLLERTVQVTERAIDAAGRRGITTFDEVLLVGGMSRFPAVARVLKERFGFAARHHEPDLAVAKGAAQFAVMRLAGATEDQEAVAAQLNLDPPQLRRLAATRVATVVPRAFGVKGVDARDPRALTDPLNARQMVIHLLPANTPLPADTGPFTFHTAIPNQRMIGIEVWEQAGPVESDDPAENRRVGEGMLKNLPPRLPARTPFEVTFFMSETGLMSVHARESQSGAEVRFDLQIGDLDQVDLERARRSVARYRVSG
jgi:molecular chaperone DnaK